MNTNIYIVTHKQVELPKEKGYIPIVVGNNNVHYSEYVRDNTGDNISEKNANYCELTALYWIWKNIDSYKNVGLCHYRRFFTDFIFTKKPISVARVEKILKKYDIIVPQTWTRLDRTVKSIYLEIDGKEKDLNNLREIIKTMYPSYIDIYDDIMNGREAFYCNMFIMPKKLLKQYCEWLFSILFELEKITDLSGYTVAQARIYGYLSERLFNVWVKKQRLKVKYIPMYEKDKGLCLKKKIKDKIKHILMKQDKIRKIISKD